MLIVSARFALLIDITLIFVDDDDCQRPFISVRLT